MYRFDDSRAARAVNFFERVLRHGKGEYAGRPFILAPWQREVIGQIFGRVDADGYRVTRTAYVEVPKKNGKSELAAGVALYCLVADNEPQAEVYSAASAKDQAALVFRVAASMVEHSPILSGKLRVIHSTKTIVRRDDPYSFYRAISADGDLQDGINPSCVIADELHRWKVQKALELWEVLERGTITRRQPLLFGITTAGVPDESPLCWRMHQLVERLNEPNSGFTSEHTFGRIWAAPADLPWDSREARVAANPSHEENGGFLRDAALAKLCEDATLDPARKAEYERYNLDRWGFKFDRWMDMEAWDACGEPLRPLMERPCYAGLDLSSSTDLTALSLVFPGDDGSFDLLSFGFMAEDRLRKLEIRDKVPYSAWQREFMTLPMGPTTHHRDHRVLTTTPGAVIDYAAVHERLRWAREMFDLREIDYDGWQATQFVKALEDDSFVCVKIPQQFSALSAPTKHLKELVLDGKIRHAGSPLLRWNASCCATRTDGKDNVMLTKPDREKSDKRIDLAAATVNAMARAMVQSGGSVYDTRGMVVLGG